MGSKSLFLVILIKQILINLHQLTLKKITYFQKVIGYTSVVWMNSNQHTTALAIQLKCPINRLYYFHDILQPNLSFSHILALVRTWTVYTCLLFTCSKFPNHLCRFVSTHIYLFPQSFVVSIPGSKLVLFPALCCVISWYQTRVISFFVLFPGFKLVLFHSLFYFLVPNSYYFLVANSYYFLRCIFPGSKLVLFLSLYYFLVANSYYFLLCIISWKQTRFISIVALFSGSKVVFFQSLYYFLVFPASNDDHKLYGTYLDQWGAI